MADEAIDVYDEIFDFRVVAAIDFGTTYSGYAYSFHQDPLKIFCPQTWFAGEGNLASLKTPTCLLLNPNRSFHSFGYTAENKYVYLASEGKHRDYFYFTRFKMDLHWKDMQDDSEIKDISGKSLPAIDVFAMSIQYLRDHLLQTLNERGTLADLSQIMFVLTVPAIWTESAKLFMRKAAVMAGIHTDQLILALEPEAASLYCQKVPDDHLSFGTSQLIRSPGVQYLVADLGGGTADFSVHELNEDGSLTEVHMATGGPYAGTTVDEAYLKLFQTVFGEKTMEKLKENDMMEYLAILRSFESKKRLVCEEFSENVSVNLATMLSKRLKKKSKKINKVLNECGLKDLVSFHDNKIKFSPVLIKSLFNHPICGILEQIQNLLRKHEAIKSIILVGGFSESRLLQEKLKESIEGKTFIIPNECGLSVLKGAVLYGHSPLSITSRIMKYSYGVASDSIFIEGVHPKERKYCDNNGESRCKRAFRVLIAKGTRVSASGVEVSRTAEPITSTQMSVLERIYYTENENPVVVDENCKLLKNYVLSLPKDNEKPRIIKSTFTFGLTELKYYAEVIETGEKIQGSLDLQ